MYEHKTSPLLFYDHLIFLGDCWVMDAATASDGDGTGFAMKSYLSRIERILRHSKQYPTVASAEK